MVVGPQRVLYAPDYASVRVIACSPPSWMVHILLEEKKLLYRVRRLDFAKGEHRTAEMLLLNPRGTLPVLSDGKAVVSETFAILEYIELTYPSPPWLPDQPPERARALTRLHEAEHVKAAGMAVFQELMRQPPDSERVDELWRAFDDELARWEHYLGLSSFAAGAEIGLADLALFTYVATAVHLGWSLASRPRLCGHHATMCRREAVRRSSPTTWSKPSASA
jgi:glutathione S-transferase